MSLSGWYLMALSRLVGLVLSPDGWGRAWRTVDWFVWRQVPGVKFLLLVGIVDLLVAG